MKNSIFYFILLTLFFCCSTKVKQDKSEDPESVSKIKNVFNHWVQSEIKTGHFFADDSCNTHYYFIKDSLGQEAGFGIGIPDDSLIHFSYADINDDDKPDALITFIPYQCDGGNATMWKQFQLLVLSDHEKYFIIDTFFKSVDINSGGWFLLDSAATNAVYGTYYKYTDNDSRCCPGIQRPIRISFTDKQLYFLDKKK